MNTSKQTQIPKGGGGGGGGAADCGVYIRGWCTPLLPHCPPPQKTA